MNTVTYLVDKRANINIKNDHGVSVYYTSEIIIVLLFGNNSLLV